MSENKIDLKDISKIHLIGIGGSGIFPIAKVLLDRGFRVTGSDSTESETTEKAKNAGIKVFIGHKAENIKDADLVVFSAAIKDDNSELVQAKRKGIPCLERSAMLGIIVDKYKKSIAVAGTHGKTSTTSLITHILLDANKDPTAIIGGALPRINGNSCVGASDIIVCEACEYVDSFLCLFPQTAVILNVDADHLDYFKNIDGVIKSFSKFASQAKGALIVNGDDINAVKCVQNAQAEKIFYGFKEDNDYYPKNIKLSPSQYPSFDLIYKGDFLTHIELSIPGQHNIYNAIAASISCLKLGVEKEELSKSIKSFKGAHRRFEILDNINGVTIADDFAHHPNEIKATITAAKGMNFKRVIVVFQPHTFSRTAMFLNEFADSLSLADKVVLTDILPVRETNTYGVHSKDLAEKISNCTYAGTFNEAAEFILKYAKPGDLVMTMGGGDVYKCAHIITALLQNNI